MCITRSLGLNRCLRFSRFLAFPNIRECINISKLNTNDLPTQRSAQELTNESSKTGLVQIWTRAKEKVIKDEIKMIFPQIQFPLSNAKIESEVIDEDHV